jgi:hypothetical protein
MDFQYATILLQKSNDSTALGRAIGRISYDPTLFVLFMNSSPGEYSISPVDPAAFSSWSERHKDSHYKVQYANNTVVLSIMYPIHDKSAAILMDYIVEGARTITGSKPKIITGTGRM